ncbi:probable DNA-directed RNA polymerase III subunit RPC3 [Zygosaccharomyces bailii]|nr:probable DNA-directed RNA polymerase III subunit RPC3 [Zygosaccharomyces bailii ISA1307]SJM88662.1 probable DNA-directed RNA polymerase III subunit RPC3 [Zygosaccharomyces bailii]
MASVAPSTAAGGAASATPALESSSASGVPSEDLVAVSSLEQRTLSPERFLYTELAKSLLGERAAFVVNILLSLGRLTVGEICTRAPSSMNARSVKTTLVSLIQLRCVKYIEETVGTTGRMATYYYFNQEGLLLFLYSGCIIEELGKRVSDPAMTSQIVQNVLSLGSITLNEYLESCDPQISKRDVTSIFVQLCEGGFLTAISKVHYTPVKVLWDKLYEKEYNAIPRNSTLSDLKKRNEAKSKAKAQFLQTLASVEDTSRVLTIDPKTSLRTVVGSVPLTINLDRFLKIRRSKQLVQLAKTRVGSIPAQVYGVALQITEQKSPNLVDPLTQTGLLQDLDEAISIREDEELMEEKTSGITFNAIDIAKYLPNSLDLRGTLSATLKSNKRGTNLHEQHPVKKMKTENGFAVPSLPESQSANSENAEEDTDEFDQLDDDGSNPHSAPLINSHLKLLASTSIPFLKEIRPGVFYVPYTKVMPILRRLTYDYIIASTLGPSAMRICRCVRENNLVSEKFINSTALMKEKDSRTTIGSLIKYNVIEIQEVPRTADRAASRAVFLFRSRETHAYNFMKQNLLWNIANLLYKKERLKEDNMTLLTKANRDDVKGKETELLLPSELNQLKMVNERELNIWTRVARLLSLWEAFKF